jgi:transketolase
MKFQPNDHLAINAIRALSIDAIEKASSGHPGLPLGAAPMAYVLWSRHLITDPKHPDWINRDRFILSAGHGSMLLYSLLHLSGFDLPLEQLKQFRQWSSLTPGHPEYGLTPGVEATTGPLGQGAANAVGMAVAECALASLLNSSSDDAPLIDYKTYALISDGDVMEGVACEAASLAGHLGLGNLICLYDANDVTLDGASSLCFSTEDVKKRYEAYGWHVQWIEDGDTDLSAIDAAIQAARSETKRPSLIGVKTTIGFGSPNKAGSSSAHGSPLGAEEAKATKASLGWPETLSAFEIPEEARKPYLEIGKRGAAAFEKWQAQALDLPKKDPKRSDLLKWIQSRELPTVDWSLLPQFDESQSIATRDAAGKALNELAKQIPFLLGGDADLSSSTKTSLQDGKSFHAWKCPEGRNIHFGVREHAMGAIANGMLYAAGLKVFVATFFCFSDYMKASIRLAAMNHLPVVFVFTHDSIGVGEDGPTHQPIEHLAALRSIPGLNVIRPADGREAVEAWKLALTTNNRPSALILTRQKLPIVSPSPEKCSQGGYVLSSADPHAPEQVCLIATGSEVHVALQVQSLLLQSRVGARVVSMPCWESFDAQSDALKAEVMGPRTLFRVSLEAASTFGWEKWVGIDGLKVGLDHFGASAPAEKLFSKFGFEPESISKKILEKLPKV